MLFHKQLFRFRIGAVADNNVVWQIGNRPPRFRWIGITRQDEHLNFVFGESPEGFEQRQSGAKTAIGFDKHVAGQQQKIDIEPYARFDDLVEGMQRSVFKRKS